MPKNVSGTVDFAQRAEHIPVIKLTVHKVSGQSFLRAGELAGLIVQTVRFDAAFAKAFPQNQCG